jgi:methyl-accepting chemotaxis protein
LSEIPKPTLEQLIANTRNEIILIHSKASETSTRGFDQIVSLLQQQSNQLKEMNDELKRLQELLEKNKIEYKNKDKK